MGPVELRAADRRSDSASREHHEYDTGPDAGIEAIRGRIETGREGVAP